MTAAVVLIHGIWMNGMEMSLLRYRIHRAGYKTHRFSYPSVRKDIKENAQALQVYIQTLEYDTLHFVAHSLGGLVVRQLFLDFPQQRPGRIVTLATPHQGSLLAKRMNRFALGRMLLGQSLKTGLLDGLPHWQATHEIGVVTGTVGLGMGTVITRLPKPNDGTVTIQESRLPGATDVISLPVSHISMLLSQTVATKVIHFLRQGKF